MKKIISDETINTGRRQLVFIACAKIEKTFKKKSKIDMFGTFDLQL